MSSDPQVLRSEQFVEIGRTLQRDATLVVERWSRRALQEQATAGRVHHKTLCDDFPQLLSAIGRSLEATSGEETYQHHAIALGHGEQRWESGWSLQELVQDYLLLRLVVLEYLEESLDRPLTCREAMAVGMAIDEAINASVGMYVAYREDEVRDLERARAEEAAKSQHALHRWEHIFRHAGWGVAMIRCGDERIIAANPAFGRLHGCIPEESIGRRLTDFVAPEQHAAIANHLRLAEQIGHDEFETLNVRVDGSRFPVLCSLTFIASNNGAPNCWAANFCDITQRRRLEDSLHEQAASLREVDRRKDEFLATLAHELRNSLSPILHALEKQSQQRPADPAIQQTQAIVERQVGLIARLVDDLLDLTRISRGRLELRKERVDLAEVVAQAVQTSQPLIEARQHKLSVDLPEGALNLEADPARLIQIVANLLNNAAKYTAPDGEISLSATAAANEVVLKIRDNGMGLAPETLGSVFEMFQQVDSSSVRSQGGLGIGLTLVRSLVMMHGGGIVARSDGLGKGSEFEVRLPRGEAAPVSAAPAPAASSPQRFNILIVEDSADTRELLRELLHWRGHQVEVAEDGPAALERFKANPPDAALIDIGLPGMDGYELVRAIRDLPAARGAFLIALTGYGQAEDRRRALDAGFDAHLVKPVRLDDLTRALESCRR